MYIKTIHAIGICLCLWMLGSTSIQAQGSDCRLKLEDLKPIIQRFNPFFANHKWNQDARLEMARMSNEQLILITQDGCKRHHVNFTMIIDPKIVVNNNDFWIESTVSMLYKAYYNQPEYETFAKEFLKEFSEKFKMYGLNNQFNFPIGTRNFICELRYNPQKGGRINVEMVQFIFKEKLELKRKGIPLEEDDGWLGKGR